MDYSKLIQDLKSYGWGQIKIAKEIGCVQSVVSELLTGTYGARGPSYRVGAALVALHKAETAKYKRRVKKSNK